MSLGSVRSSSPSPTASYATAGSLPRGASPPSPSPSSASFPYFSFEVGDLVTPRYRITGQLDRDATSITYAAEHTASVWPRPGHALTLKVFPLTALTSWKTLDVFQREAASLRILEHRVNIDFFELDDALAGRVFVLVQPRVTNDSLQHLIDLCTWRAFSSAPSPSLTPRPSSPFEIGDLVTPRYRIIGQLGGGATSTTYAAEHTASVSSQPGRALALKVFPRAALMSRKTLDVFQREAVTLRTLAHPAIPAYIDFFEHDDARGDRVFVLVQHRATGASLERLSHSRVPFSAPDVYAVFRQLLEVLVYLGDLNPSLLHCDIKPGNVILGVEGGCDPPLSLVNFGAVNTAIATVGEKEEIGENQSVPGPFPVAGTSGFTPPEHVGGTVDVRSDLYSAAATVLYMLTGRPLCTLPQTRRKIDMENVIPASERVELGNVYTVMCTLLEPAPEDRYECASEALDALLGKNPHRSSRTGATVLSEADAASLECAVRKLQMVTRESAGGDGGRGVRNLSELPSNRAAGGDVRRRKKPAGSRVSLQRSRSDRLLRVNRWAKPFPWGPLWYGGWAAVLIGCAACFTALGRKNEVIDMTWMVVMCWVLAVFLIWETIVEMTKNVTLIVSFGAGRGGDNYFQLRKANVLFFPISVRGDAQALRAAEVETPIYVRGYQPGRPTAVQKLVLIEGEKKHVFGEYLSLAEKEWVRDEINDFLNAHRR